MADKMVNPCTFMQMKLNFQLKASDKKAIIFGRCTFSIYSFAVFAYLSTYLMRCVHSENSELGLKFKTWCNELKRKFSFWVYNV